MKTTLVSKNNIGGALALLLVILLSQTRFFNFLLDTALGRAFLILFILVISYTNKILGVVSVLFIIIMFNSSDLGYLEGFDTPTDSNTTDSNTTSTTSSTVAASSTKPNKKPHNKSATPATKKQPTPSVSNDTQTSTDTTTPSTASTTPTISTATEGFNTLDNERTIQKGKQSNSIPVNNMTRESYTNVEPFDGGSKFGIF